MGQWRTGTVTSFLPMARVFVSGRIGPVTMQTLRSETAAAGSWGSSFNPKCTPLLAGCAFSATRHASSDRTALLQKNRKNFSPRGILYLFLNKETVILL